MYYKILYLPEATYLQELVKASNPRHGTTDAIFLTEEDAVDRIRGFVVNSASLDDINDPELTPTFFFNHYSIEAFEGDPPSNPTINNKIDPNEPINLSHWLGLKPGNLGLR